MGLLIFSSFTIFIVSAPVRSAEGGLFIASWSLWGGALIGYSFFYLGGGAIYIDGFCSVSGGGMVRILVCGDLE